ncbi:MAG: carboxypeptidase regulatory-like domain-containing protein [Prevotella sp.]|nr:carboxypeptidase regulatory-like domain-containing protein [Prevotella sp.]
MQKRLFFLVAAMMVFTTMVAQITTSTMTGKVTEATPDGVAIIGATVQAVHEPSGTRYATVTNSDGRFDIQGMRTGGPYSVTVSYIGYQTKVLKEITLQLGETYNLSVWLSEDANELNEVLITAAASKFAAEKTGATTNISNLQMMSMPTVTRGISDIAKLSPYANGMSFAGGDGRSTNFTIDGANFNNNFGLSANLPGGGNPISLDAIEEVQVVVAPFDVRQTNFIGGGINAITKSGTNTFKGTAYVYYRDQDLRGNRINHIDLGARADEAHKTYGFTLGGPIWKNKLFFFVNYEKEVIPGEVIKYRARQDGEAAGGMVSRTTLSDMQKASNYLVNTYGYDPGSYTNFPADESNEKVLARVDWNITDRHHLAVRFNNTKNVAWNAPNGNSADFLSGSAARLNNTYRVGTQSMAFANSMYSMENKVQSWSADLNSRFTNSISNQLLFTYTNIEDVRGSNSSIFPFIDIMNGLNADGNQILEPYMSAGYELFSYNNGVHNKITNITDNFTFYLPKHKITAGVNFEHQYANNAYMREGTGYYRYRSLDEFLSGAAPETVAFTYGFNGVSNPNAQVTFNQLGLYAQDEWNMTDRFKLSFGARFDNLMFDNKDLQRNNAIYALDFRDGKKVDTGLWPKSNWQISPRLGFTWDVKGDKTLKVRGGTGIFTGRLPLVFFTNMPTNASMVQLTQVYGTKYKAGKDSDGRPVGVVTYRDAELDQFAGKMITTVDELIQKTGVPTTNENYHVAGSKISGVDSDFKMPQVWKSSIAVDYRLPVSFPLTLTGEFIYTKNINAVTIDNINIMNPDDTWQRFAGADNRLRYPSTYNIVKGKNAVMLTNTSKGHGYTANVTLNAEPVKDLNIMMAYTHTEMKEISGMPGSDPVSTWQGMITVDGPNNATVQRSQYVIPNKVIASVNYYIPFRHKGLLRGTHLNLFYTGYKYGSYSFCYTNDMNGDGLSNDLMYIPANDNEIQIGSIDADGNFVNDATQRAAFWAFVNQDSYLKNHKGEYAEAYAARAPWVHQFDLRIAEDFAFRIGATTHKFQASLDFLNVGNLINSGWGIPKTNTVSNGNRILTYNGVDNNNVPVFSMYKVNGAYPTETYATNMDWSNCWKLQVGIKYFFNDKIDDFDNSVRAKQPKALSQSQLDALNAQLKAKQDEINSLKSQLANQKPEVKTVEKVVNKTEVLAAPVSVFFNIGEATVANPSDLQNVKDLVKLAKDNNKKIVITGYADSKTGNAEINNALSQKRAEAIADELVKMGVSRDNIKIVSEGGTDALTPNTYNRRAVVSIM